MNVKNEDFFMLSKDNPKVCFDLKCPLRIHKITLHPSNERACKEWERKWKKVVRNIVLELSVTQPKTGMKSSDTLPISRYRTSNDKKPEFNVDIVLPNANEGEIEELTKVEVSIKNSEATPEDIEIKVFYEKKPGIKKVVPLKKQPKS